MSNKLKFGLLGALGYIAPRHIQAINNINADLMCVSDLDFNPAQKKEFHSKHIETLDSLEEMIRYHQQHSLDYISICTPNHLHTDQIISCLENNINVICEKPLALSIKDLDRIRKSESGSSASIFTIMQLRFHESIIQLKEKITSQRLDEKHEVILIYATTRGSEFFSSWRGSENKSGGILFEFGIHYLDILIDIFGQVINFNVNKLSLNQANVLIEHENAKVLIMINVLSKEKLEEMGQEEVLYRSFTINGNEFEFTGGFQDLHTRSYESILEGKGFTVEDASKSITQISKIMDEFEKGSTYKPILNNL